MGSLIEDLRHYKLEYLPIIEWGWVSCEEWKSSRVLSAEAVGRDLHNSSDYKKAEFNNFFVIHLKIFPNYKKKTS